MRISKLSDNVIDIRYFIFNFAFFIMLFINTFISGVSKSEEKLSASIVNTHSISPELGGDTELIEARLGENFLGLITYVQNRSRGFCWRTGQIMQNVFVSLVDPYTGLPDSSQAKRVGENECGNPVLSDAEFGLDSEGHPLLAYTSEAGVQMVYFQGDSWNTMTFSNQKIPGSDRWQIAGEPLSVKLPELQIEVIVNSDSDSPNTNRSSSILWSRILTDSSGKIVDIERIYKFNNWLLENSHASFKSHIHPEDPTRFIRVSSNGIYEFLDDGIDSEIIHDQFPKSPMRTWVIPDDECIKLGLKLVNSLQSCPAIVFGEYNSKEKKWNLLVKAKDFNNKWIEILRIPYSSAIRVNATVINHLTPPRSAILVTGDGDAKIYFLNGSYFLVNSNANRESSEMLYFSESQLLGVYYRDTSTEQLMVSMVYFSPDCCITDTPIAEPAPKSPD